MKLGRGHARCACSCWKLGWGPVVVSQQRHMNLPDSASKKRWPAGVKATAPIRPATSGDPPISSCFRHSSSASSCNRQAGRQATISKVCILSSLTPPHPAASFDALGQGVGPAPDKRPLPRARCCLPGECVRPDAAPHPPAGCAGGEACEPLAGRLLWSTALPHLHPPTRSLCTECGQ